MGKVVRLRLVKKPRNASVVSTLKAVRLDANQGNLSAIAVGIVRPDGSINTVFSDSDQAAAMLGSVSLLSHRLLSAVEAGAD